MFVSKNEDNVKNNNSSNPANIPEFSGGFLSFPEKGKVRLCYNAI